MDIVPLIEKVILVCVGRQSFEALDSILTMMTDAYAKLKQPMEETLSKVFEVLFTKAKQCLVPKESNISEVAKLAIRAHSCFLKNIEAAVD